MTKPDERWRDPESALDPPHHLAHKVVTKVRTPMGAFLRTATWYSLTGCPLIDYRSSSRPHPWVTHLPPCEATAAPEAIQDEDPDHTPERLFEWEERAVW